MEKANKNCLPEKDVKKYLKEVSSAVEYLHKSDVLHRDLKPENVLLHEVLLMEFRTLPKFAISVGRSTLLSSETLSVELLFTLLLKSSRTSSTTTRSMSGVWEFSPMNCCTGSRRLRSASYEMCPRSSHRRSNTLLIGVCPQWLSSS